MRRLSGQDELDKDRCHAFGHVLETSSTEAATETKAIAQDESVEQRLPITPRLIQVSSQICAILSRSMAVIIAAASHKRVPLWLLRCIESLP